MMYSLPVCMGRDKTCISNDGAYLFHRAWCSFIAFQTKAIKSNHNTDCPPKNYNRHLGIDCEIPVYGIWKIKPDYETMTFFFYKSVKTPSALAKYSHKEIIMDFCKASHRSLSSKFCHLNVCGFHRQIVFTREACKHAHLSNIYFVPDTLKACQMCKNHVNNTFHNNQGQ